MISEEVSRPRFRIAARPGRLDAVMNSQSPPNADPRDRRPEVSKTPGIVDVPDQGVGLLELPEMRFQEHYVWLIFVGSLDIMLTWVILRNGGEEVNPVAKLVIDAWGLNGAIAFKFALTLFVIIACEAIARVRPLTALILIWFGVLISSFPPVWSVFLLAMHAGEQ